MELFQSKSFEIWGNSTQNFAAESLWESMEHWN